MSDTYTKLFRSIAASTIVSEPLATRWLWVTMLSQADKAGKVYASVPGLARMANITLAECEAGIECFLSPDPYSRTTEHEGRRIEAVDGGWRLLNHAKYDAMRNEAERREKKREWDRKNRPSGHHRTKQAGDDVTGQSDNSPTQSDETRQSGPISHSSFPITQQEQKQKALVQRSAARFEDFWAIYPEKKGKAAARKAWVAKNCDLIADRIMAHVSRMQAEDRGWREGYIPHGATYVRGERWQDEPKRVNGNNGHAPQSKTMGAIQRLEGIKNGLADTRDHDGLPEAALLGFGPHAGH